jgi:type VI secretion system protein ImpG
VALDRYYSDELAYLRDLGDEFARENPALAPFLSRQSNDPDVERLLEGFAFLTARLRQKLDDEIPELSHSLIQILYPHYLRPTPAFSIVEFTTAGPETPLPKGSQVQSRPIDGTRCTFQTCYPITVRPLRVADVQVETGATSSVLRLRLAAIAGQSLDRLDLGRLLIHLSTERDPLTTRTLYEWFRLHVSGVRVQAGVLDTRIGGDAVQPFGFAPSEGLIPYPDNAFEGFRSVEEYFAFPDKFMFIELTGLNVLKAAAGASEATVTVTFDRPLPERFRPPANTLRVNCTPVVNLFPHDAQPLTVDHHRTEYRVRPESANVDHYGIFSVDRVVGWERGRSARREYAAFETFAHLTGQATGHFFRTRLRPAVVRGQPETYISFMTPRGSTLIPDSETIALALTCTNGRLAENVPVGAIDQVTAMTPASLTFRNISAVSRELPPPIEGDLLWQMIGALSRNYASVADLDSLKLLLATHDIGARTDLQARRRLELLQEGLVSSTLAPLDWSVRGIPIRGQRMRLTVVESKLGGASEIFLLGCVLDAFIASYAAINSCHQLVIDGEETKAHYEWPVRFGTRPAI